MKKALSLLISLIFLCGMALPGLAEHRFWDLDPDMPFDEAEEYLYSEKGIVMQRYSNGYGTMSDERTLLMGYPGTLLIYNNAEEGSRYIKLLYGLNPYDDSDMFRYILETLIEETAMPDEVQITVFSNEAKNWYSPSYTDPIRCKREAPVFEDLDDLLDFDIEEYVEDWEYSTVYSEADLDILIGNVLISYKYFYADDTMSLEITYYKNDMKFSTVCGEFSRNTVYGY